MSEFDRSYFMFSMKKRHQSHRFRNQKKRNWHRIQMHANIPYNCYGHAKYKLHNCSDQSRKTSDYKLLNRYQRLETTTKKKKKETY